MSLLDETEDAQSFEGLEEAEDKILRFVKNILESVELEGDEYVFSVFKTGRGSDEEDPVASYEASREDKPAEITKELLEATLEDVSDYHKGTHRYVVRCEDVKARCTFSIKVNDKSDEDMDDVEEPPNKKGLLAQMMRHTEAFMKVSVGSAAKTIEQQSKMLAAKDERIRALEESQVQTIRLTEDLMSGRHARDIELKKLEKKEKRMDEIAGTVMQAAPVLLSIVSGKGMPVPQMTGGQPAGDMQLEALVEGLMGSFTSEQFQAIASSGMFTPTQIMTLVEIAKRVQAKEQTSDAHSPQNGVANEPVQAENKV